MRKCNNYELVICAAVLVVYFYRLLCVYVLYSTRVLGGGSAPWFLGAPCKELRCADGAALLGMLHLLVCVCVCGGTVLYGKMSPDALRCSNDAIRPSFSR